MDMGTGIMPTLPIGGMGNNGILGGGLDGILVGALLTGGLGNWNNRGGVADAAIASQTNGQITGIQTQLSGLQSQITANSITSEISEVESSITSLAQGVCNGFATVNSNLAANTFGLSNAITSSSAQTNEAINNGFANLTVQNINNANSILGAINGLASKMDSQTITQLAAENASLTAQLNSDKNLAAITNEVNELKSALQACCCQNNQAHSTVNQTDAVILGLLNQINGKIKTA